MESKCGIYFGNPTEIKITNCHWIIPEHDCRENEALFVTKDESRMLCKVYLNPVNRGSCQKVIE